MLRTSWSGLDMYHGMGAWVEVHGQGDAEVPHLHIYAGDGTFILSPAMFSSEGDGIDQEHVHFARQLAGAAYEYMELLVRKQIEAPTAS